jgi:hypothetical protein
MISYNQVAYKLNQFRRWVRYKLNPPRCCDCNTKLITGDAGYFEGRINNEELYVRLIPARCRNCAEDYVKQLRLAKVKCHSCGNIHTGTGYHNKNKNILILMWDEVWNGSEHCVDCITHVIKTGNIETSYRIRNDRTKKFESVYY